MKRFGLVVALASLFALACPDEPPRPPKLGADAVAVTFESRPSGAVVAVDGYGYGPAPLTVRVEPGRHEVSVQLPGYLPHRGELVVRAGDATRYEANLIASH